MVLKYSEWACWRAVPLNTHTIRPHDTKVWRDCRILSTGSSQPDHEQTWHEQRDRCEPHTPIFFSRQLLHALAVPRRFLLEPSCPPIPPLVEEVASPLSSFRDLEEVLAGGPGRILLYLRSGCMGCSSVTRAPLEDVTSWQKRWRNDRGGREMKR